MPADEPSVLLLIPAYNEEARIGPVLRRYAEHFSANYRGHFQIVVVMNGCRDNTKGVVAAVARDFDCVSALDFPEPIGKGGALIEGLRLAALTELIGFVDADGATPPEAYQRLIDQLGDHDCVVGSRWLPGAVVRTRQSRKRRFASRTFHLIVQFLFWMNIRDTQCGAKVMRCAAVEAVHGQLRIADMSFDINLLYSLKRAGYRLIEVPTEWADQGGSTVVLGRTSLTMFLSAVRLRLVYSPLRPVLRWLAPLEAWIYRKLRAPAPRRARAGSPSQPLASALESKKLMK